MSAELGQVKAALATEMEAKKAEKDARVSIVAAHEAEKAALAA